MKWKTFGILGLVTAAPALAQTPIPQDVTDGMYVTVAEVRSNSMDTFEAFAGPDGGPISRQEFVSTRVPDDIYPNKAEAPQLERLFGLLDANSDGQLTLGEWRDRINKDLGFADQNSDGRISMKELTNARQNMSIGDTLGMVF